MRRAVAHLAEMIGQKQCHEQHAKRSGYSEAERPRQRRKKGAHQRSSDKEVEKSPNHIDDRRGLANPPRRSKRRLKLVTANALHEMRYAVGEERTGKEMREIVIPGHDL